MIVPKSAVKYNRDYEAQKARVRERYHTLTEVKQRILQNSKERWTGKFRDWLCVRCNAIVGQVENFWEAVFTYLHFMPDLPRKRGPFKKKEKKSLNTPSSLTPIERVEITGTPRRQVRQPYVSGRYPQASLRSLSGKMGAYESRLRDYNATGQM